MTVDGTLSFSNYRNQCTVTWQYLKVLSFYIPYNPQVSCVSLQTNPFKVCAYASVAGSNVGGRVP